MGESTRQIRSHILTQSSICCSLMMPIRSQLFLPSSCWNRRFLLQLRIAWQHQGFSSQRCKRAPGFFWYSTYTRFDYLYLHIHMVEIWPYRILYHSSFPQWTSPMKLYKWLYLAKRRWKRIILNLYGLLHINEEIETTLNC
jgi:hypothetical protein